MMRILGLDTSNLKRLEKGLNCTLIKTPTSEKVTQSTTFIDCTLV